MQTGIQRPESLSSSLRGFFPQSNLILYQCFLYKLKGQLSFPLQQVLAPSQNRICSGLLNKVSNHS